MKVNGLELEIASLENSSIYALIQHFKLKPDMVAVERNGQIEKKENWDSIQLAEQDQIELIKFIGGG